MTYFIPGCSGSVNSLEILIIARNNHALWSSITNMTGGCLPASGTHFTCWQPSHDLDWGPVHSQSARGNQKARSRQCQSRTCKAVWLLCCTEGSGKSLVRVLLANSYSFCACSPRSSCLLLLHLFNWAYFFLNCLKLYQSLPPYIF